MAEYPSAKRVREVFTYDEVNNCLLYRVAPHNKPKLLGRRAGRIDKRDGAEYVPVDGRMFSARKIIALHLTGALPKKPPHYKKMTLEYLKAHLAYDVEAGVFTRLQNAGPVKAGSRADYMEQNGYRYVNFLDHRFIAARLAWFYVHGEWPEGRVFVKDENPDNIAFGNLELAEFGDLKVPSIKRAYDKAHRQRNPGWHRAQNLKRDFGISLEQYQDAFAAQGGVCACCGQPEVSERDGKRKWLAVDHDHADSSFRGLLCSNCNQGLGRFKDDAEVLRKAAAYLDAHAAKPKTNVIPLAGRRIASNGGQDQ